VTASPSGKTVEVALENVNGYMFAPESAKVKATAMVRVRVKTTRWDG
jgi:hypothetical protein